MSSLTLRSIALISLSLGLAVTVPACASTVLNAGDYDQTCKAASDCIDVLVGDVCSCGCDDAAIAKSAQATFQADDTAARGACGSSSIECVACPDKPAPTCVSGKCVASP
jgi:hypothetical protein